MITIYGYSKCSTVKKELNFLQEHNIQHTHIDNVENRLSAKQIKEIHELSKVDIKKLFNTSGMKYRELNLKDKLKEMNLQQKYELLASDGMLVKRPLLVTENIVIIGFKSEQILTELA